MPRQSYKQNPRTEHLNLLISKELRRKIERYAGTNDLSMNEGCIQILEDFFAENKDALSNKPKELDTKSRMTLYTLKEVSEHLGISLMTIRKYVASGELQAKMIGGKWRVSEVNLIEFIERK